MSITEQKIKVGELEWFYRLAEPIGRTDLLPVLLLHGLPSQSYSWRNIMPGLAAQGTKAIAPDWIGYGFSAKPEKREFAYTPDAFITALAQFVEALELKRFSLVVQGFLGSVGLQYALRHSGQIASLVILNTPISTTAKLPWKMQQLGLPLAGEVFTQDPLLVDRTLEGGSRYQISDADLDIYRKPFLTSSISIKKWEAFYEELLPSKTNLNLVFSWNHMFSINQNHLWRYVVFLLSNILYGV